MVDGTVVTADPITLSAKLRSKVAWRLGDPPVVVTTASGGRYELREDGRITGGSLGLRRARFLGTNYWSGGIYAGVVMRGERMFLCDPDAPAGKRDTVLTTTVSRVEPLEGGSR